MARLVRQDGRLIRQPGGSRLLVSTACSCCGEPPICPRYVRYEICNIYDAGCTGPDEFYTCSDVCPGQNAVIYFAGRCYQRRDEDGCFWRDEPVDGCNPIPVGSLIVNPDDISCVPIDCFDEVCDQRVWYKAVPCSLEDPGNPPCLWIPCENMAAFMDGRACAIFGYLGTCWTLSWSSETFVGEIPPPPCSIWGDVPSFFYSACCECYGAGCSQGNECGSHPTSENIWFASETDDVVVIPEGAPDCCTSADDFVSISMTRDHIIYRANGTRDIRNQTWEGTYGRNVSTAQFYQRREVEQTGDVTIFEAPISPICGTPGSGLWKPYAEDIDGNVFRLWDQAAGFTNSFVSGAWTWNCNRLAGSLLWERYTSGGDLSETIQISGSISVTRSIGDCSRNCPPSGVYPHGGASGWGGVPVGVWGVL